MQMFIMLSCLFVNLICVVICYVSHKRSKDVLTFVQSGRTRTLVVNTEDRTITIIKEYTEPLKS